MHDERGRLARVGPLSFGSAMPKRILVINAGSSSLKFGAYAADREPRLELK